MLGSKVGGKRRQWILLYQIMNNQNIKQKDIFQTLILKKEINIDFPRFLGIASLDEIPVAKRSAFLIKKESVIH